MKLKILDKYRQYFSLSNITFTLLVGIVIFYFLFQTLVLSPGYPQVTVETTSMTPTYQGYNLKELSTREKFDIFRGDVLLIQDKTPQVGDTVVFRLYNSNTGQPFLIIHRIVAKEVINNTEFYSTKGDNNSLTDLASNFNNYGWIPKSNIVGVVIFSIHHLGWFLHEFNQLSQFLIQNILFIAIILLIVYYFLYYRKKSSPNTKLVSKTNIEFFKKIRIIFKKRIIEKRVNLYVIYLIIILSFPLMYSSIGFTDYLSHTNQVDLDLHSNTDMVNSVIDLRFNSSNTEVYDNFAFYNYHLRVTSSGTFNYVSKVIVSTLYNNYSLINPDYVWTIVYDFSGTKMINAVQYFNITDLLTIPMVINATLTFHVYSAGLLAQAPVTHSININIRI